MSTIDFVIDMFSLKESGGWWSLDALIGSLSNLFFTSEAGSKGTFSVTKFTWQTVVATLPTGLDDS